MALTVPKEDKFFKEDKKSETLKKLIANGLRDMEEGRTVSPEEAFGELDKI